MEYLASQYHDGSESGRARQFPRYFLLLFVITTQVSMAGESKRPNIVLIDAESEGDTPRRYGWTAQPKSIRQTVTAPVLIRDVMGNPRGHFDSNSEEPMLIGPDPILLIGGQFSHGSAAERLRWVNATPALYRLLWFTRCRTCESQG
ncbi:MAG: hypothetical protein AAGJ40_03500 [Planctomycetota bacterium]